MVGTARILVSLIRLPNHLPLVRMSNARAATSIRSLHGHTRKNMDADTKSERHLLISSNKPRSIYRRPGWSWNITCCALGTSLVLITNVTLLIWGFKESSHVVEDGNIRLYDGPCEGSKRIFTWAHLAINILSTSLLAASNVGMQCAIAPTREDVDRAHRRGQWMHIGVMSWKNFRNISWLRIITCVVLGLSSLPLHLL